MRLFYRTYHFILKCIVIFIGIPNPKLHRGRSGLVNAIASLQLAPDSNVLLVTDRQLEKLGITSPVKRLLEDAQLNVVVYNNVEPNPTIENVESGVSCYLDNQCQAIVSVGGGSVLDCGKFIGARIVKPNKSTAQLKGLFKVLKRLPPNIAIPTTAGTGSETTVAAVINDPENKQKYAATDFMLVPQHAVLMPELTTTLPPHITATTAIDALTHAIEALLSINCMTFARQKALDACVLIFEHLPEVLKNGQNKEARESLLLASHYAGQAFTRTSVGYVHAISHQLSATYGTPHGLANAVLLMPVLRWYGKRIHKTLAQIARACQLTSMDYPLEKQAEDLLTHIERLLEQANIQSQLPEIRAQDIKHLIQAALNEAHPDYPVPVFMSELDCRAVLNTVIPIEVLEQTV
ncbi:iron-containing alcohol dehydrogenase [Pseudoalteromonas xiamenensis]|uniref:iron-containing alcohol dehydrogenase n=1 Tax=Pseudoalteromonas xiamenensis TaxID=882626 RepID=UPI0035EEFCA1